MIPSISIFWIFSPVFYTAATANFTSELLPVRALADAYIHPPRTGVGNPNALHGAGNKILEIQRTFIRTLAIIKSIPVWLTDAEFVLILVLYLIPEFSILQNPYISQTMNQHIFYSLIYFQIKNQHLFCSPLPNRM